ncbi:MAG: PotD/PotF family extracellular solute-binding protein [Actinomycetales bacterium]
MNSVSSVRPTRRAVLKAGLISAVALGGLSGCARPAAKSSQVIFSNWPMYMDVPEPGVPGTLDLFTQRTGVAVVYQEDINDGQTFYAKVRDQLESGRGIDRDIVVFSEETAQLFVELGYAQPLDYARIPNAVNLLPRLAQASFDPQRTYTLPWQSGFTGFGFNSALLAERTGWAEVASFAQFFDERLKGRVSVLGETMDTMGPMLAWQGFDPSNFTDDQFDQTLDVLAQYVQAGFIRQVTGNDYIAGLESGDLIASIGWSGDVLALGEQWGFALPESGGIVWADSMLIPIGAPNKAGAEDLMNHYYDPLIAAQVAAWIQYVCPVNGAQEAMSEVDPALVDDPWIFPSAQVLDSCFVTQALSLERAITLDRKFDRVMGL